MLSVNVIPSKQCDHSFYYYLLKIAELLQHFEPAYFITQCAQTTASLAICLVMLE